MTKANPTLKERGVGTRTFG